MMFDFQAELDALVVALEADLPSRLAAKGLDDFEVYLADTPRGDEIRQLGVFQGTGVIAVEERENEIILQAELPGIERPTEYLSVLVNSIRSIDPEVVGMQTLEQIELLALYAGMPPEGGGGSWINLSLIYTTQFDDCDD